MNYRIKIDDSYEFYIMIMKPDPDVVIEDIIYCIRFANRNKGVTMYWHEMDPEHKELSYYYRPYDEEGQL